ncbi:MAG: DUF2752 domain-containing protein [Bacteroidales bacterium]
MYKSLLGIECPGCGMQRSFIEMLRGNFLDSLALYPALIPSMFMIMFLIIHLIFKLQWGAIMLKFLFLMNALIIVLHYIYRILT